MTSMGVLPRIAPMVFDLPVLSAADATKKYIGPIVPTVFSIGSEIDGRIEVALDHYTDLKTVEEEIHIMVGDENIIVRMEHSFIRPLLHKAGLQNITDEIMLDSSLAAICLEHLLTYNIENIQIAHDTHLQIISVTGPISPICADAQFIPFRLLASLWPKGNAGEIITQSHGAASAIGNLLSEFIPEDHWHVPDLSFSVRVTSGSFQLMWNDLRSMKPGDGLLFEPDFPLRSEICLEISSCNHAFGTWQDDKITITKIINRGRKSMGPNTADTYDDDGILVEDLPVILSLELDRINLRLSDLGDLRIGTILPFRAGPPKKVKVLANGRPIATADLLLIDDRMGIRITSLSSNLGN